MIAGCSSHADGWVDRTLMQLMRVRLDVVNDVDRIFLCSQHLLPFKPGAVERSALERQIAGAIRDAFETHGWEPNSVGSAAKRVVGVMFAWIRDSDSQHER
jgi:hypothetical protein